MAFDELFVKVWVDVTSLFWVMLVRRAGPRGLRRAGLRICRESVDCSCTTLGAELCRGGEESVGIWTLGFRMVGVEG